MIIVIDRDIPFAETMFSGRADVVAIPCDAITPDSVKNADALIVRSPTKVDEKLLACSRVGFVGTATSGIDHVDREYLDRRGIAFAHAPGCNAESVAEYVVAALVELSARFGFGLAGMSIGVVGVGNVGSRVARKAAALGMRVLLNDPPLEREKGGKEFIGLRDALRADIVTFHVPLERAGPDPTFHMLNAGRIDAMRTGSIVLNTARGGVVDAASLLGALDAGRLRAAVIDVWEGEPAIDPRAVGKATISTAHIAGYSADGKVRGASMMYEALCEWKQWQRTWVAPPDSLTAPSRAEIMIDDSDDDDRKVLRRLVTTCCPIMRDDADLRKITGLPEGERSRHFIGLRNNYPPRREFSAYTVTVGPDRVPLVRTLQGLGFSVRTSGTRSTHGGGP